MYGGKKQGSCKIPEGDKLQFIVLFGGEATLGPLFEGAGKNL